MNRISQIRKVQDLYQVLLENGTFFNVSDLMILDFDGAQNVAYRNNELNLTVNGINVTAALEEETQDAVIEQLNAAASSILYLSTAEAAALNLPADSVSTIYVGDTTDLDKLGGAFSGIAETTGAAAAASKADNAFVLTNRIGSVEELVAVIAHEAGHLAGTIAHDHGHDGLSLDDFMNHSRVEIPAGKSSSFSDETFSGLTSGTRGGAILNSGTVTIDQTTFSKNRATNYGGAIYNFGSATLTSTTFTSNSTTSAGGAIYNGSKKTVTLSDVTFSGNSATSFGGAIYNNTSAMASISGTTFIANSAKSGGAIFNATGAVLNVTNAFFSANSGSGGAIFNATGAVLNVTNAFFSANNGNHAILNESGASATITNTEFSGHTAFNAPAMLNRGNAIFSNTIFKGNGATLNESEGNGGAIVNSASFSAFGGSFLDNSANDRGGAFFNTVSGCALLEDVLFSGNRALNSAGGAVYNAGTLTVRKSSSGNASFVSNSANSGAAVFNNATLSIHDAEFTGNFAKTHGGAIYNTTANGVALISNAQFSGNTADIGGGAIFNYGNTTNGSATVSIFDTTFTKNSAASFGGAINNAGAATISGGLFEGNSAVSGGGAILNAANASVKVTGVTFTGNNGSMGGAINNAGTATISGAQFINNSADNDGGAIFNIGSLELSSVYFSGNTAGENATGAIDNYGSNAKLTLTGGNIFATSTDTIRNRGLATLEIRGSNTFGGNLINGSDGKVVFDSAAVTTLSGAAKLINRNSSASQVLQGTFLVLHDAVVSATTATTNLADEFATKQASGLVWDCSKAKVGTTVYNAVELGSSFTNDNDAKLWFGSYNGQAGITDNVMELNATITDENEDYSKFNALEHLNSTYDDFDGIINVTGGNYNEKMFAEKASWLISGAADFGGKYLFAGGLSSDGKNNSVSVEAAATNLKGLFGGNQFLTSDNADATLSEDTSLVFKSGAADSKITMFTVAGSLINGTGTVTDSAAHSLTVDTGANITSKYLFGANIVGGNRIVTNTGNITMNLSAGTYTCVAGAGYLQGSGESKDVSCTASLTQNGSVTMSITGGSYQVIYGGVAGQYASYVSNVIMTGDVNITVDTQGSNQVSLKSLFGGHSSTGTFKSDVNVTFTGKGENLTFESESTVNGGNATKTFYHYPEPRPTRTLSFNAFTGAFKTKYIEAFSDIEFTEASKVTFTSNTIDLANVTGWAFELETSLDWQNGENSFAGDTLVFGKNGDTLASDWTVIDGGNATLFQGLQAADSVTLFGKSATWTNNAWCTAEAEGTNYRLYVDGNDLKIGQLA